MLKRTWQVICYTILMSWLLNKELFRVAIGIKNRNVLACQKNFPAFSDYNLVGCVKRSWWSKDSYAVCPCWDRRCHSLLQAPQSLLVGSCHHFTVNSVNHRQVKWSVTVHRGGWADQWFSIPVLEGFTQSKLALCVGRESLQDLTKWTLRVYISGNQ